MFMQLFIFCGTYKLMIEISSCEFNKLVRLKADFVLHFWAQWNGYDVMQKRICKEVNAQFDTINFYEMDVDIKENWDICSRHQVFGPPTIVFYKAGRLMGRVVVVLEAPVLTQKIEALHLYSRL